jgi:hypothetical protein
MRKDVALSVAMPTIKIITMGMLMWGVHGLTVEPARAATCYTCSWIDDCPAVCSEPGPGDMGFTGCVTNGSGGCQYSGSQCWGDPLPE